MKQEEFELHMFAKKSFGSLYSESVEMALRLEFPEIKNLTVDMNEDGTVLIVFDETIYTKEQVQNFVDELKKSNPQPKFGN